MRVLFVAPSNSESAWLFKALQESAHSLQRADELRDGVFLAGQETFDAVVIMVLDASVYPLLRTVLAEFAAVANGAALMAVLGAATAQERARVLRAGADACFCQPYSFIEMHERMQALQRIGVAVAPSGASLGLDAGTRELVCGDRRVAVTRREFLLLECLLKQINAPVPREQLIRYAWPEVDDVDPSSVNLVVSRLRRKIGGVFPEVGIETISRYGYQVSFGE
jgi:two-component system OmpR family response regulator